MSANPRRVLADFDLYWPPGNTKFPLHIRKGTVIDAAPGSALESAYGAANLEDVSPAQLGRGETLDKSFLSN